MEVLDYADQAMYEAKEAGRDRMCRLPPRRGPPPPTARLDEAERIRTGLAEDRLVLYASRSWT